MKTAKPRVAKRARKIIPTPAAAPLRPGPVAAARTTPLGRKLTELRGARTISEAAETAGVSRMVWHRWETGQREPSYAQLTAIARAFGAKPLELAAAAMEV